eukprot:scaffold918_cov126-Cylindrotheca_fusiformis.AAC.26
MGVLEADRTHHDTTALDLRMAPWHLADAWALVCEGPWRLEHGDFAAVGLGRAGCSRVSASAADGHEEPRNDWIVGLAVDENVAGFAVASRRPAIEVVGKAFSKMSAL